VTDRPWPSFRLPAFPRFGQALHHPDTARLEGRCRTWLTRTLADAYLDRPGEFERFLGQRTALWTLLTHPTVPADRAETLCRWIDVLFSLDDLFVHATPQRARRLGLHHLRTVVRDQRAAAGTAHVDAVAALCRHTNSTASPAVWGRFADALDGFLDACLTERHWQDTGEAVDLPTYVQSRIRSVGECCFPLLEHGLGVDLTRELAERPELHRLNTLVARHWVGVNDIFSYRKEHYNGDTANEITLALADNGGDLQAAVDRVAGTVRATENDFTAVRDRLLTGPASRNLAVMRYVEALRWMIAGNLEWSYITTRYNGAGHVWDGRTDAIVTLTPQRTLYSPAPIDTAPSSIG
jgi:hypothetical protein